MGYGHNFKDLTGQQFGLLKVIEVNADITKRVFWDCICECGRKTTANGTKLASGHTQSCGCLRHKERTEDLTGQKFNNLTALHIAEKGVRVRWCCICDCGNKTYVFAYNLKNGGVKSCGCLGKNNLTKHRTTHGLSHTQLATTLDNMKGRCYRPSTESYYNYGGRGIKICDEWLADCNNFYQWALNNGFKKGLTIERIDCDKDYCPENCTWIPLCEQSRNRRISLGVEKVKEIKKLLKEGLTSVAISKIYNVHSTTIGYIKRGKAYSYVN